jgi:hypothetical protein
VPSPLLVQVRVDPATAIEVRSADGDDLLITTTLANEGDGICRLVGARADIHRLAIDLQGRIEDLDSPPPDPCQTDPARTQP